MRLTCIMNIFLLLVDFYYKKLEIYKRGKIKVITKRLLFSYKKVPN